jgi:hypothetical protein
MCELSESNLLATSELEYGECLACSDAEVYTLSFVPPASERLGR